MPLGNHILASVRRQVSLEPDLLGRPNATAAGHELALTVEIDNMPVAPGDVVAVVAFATCIGRVGAVIAKVAVEALGSTRPPIVVARHRASARQNRLAAPGCRGVAIREIGEGAVGIDVVTGGEDSAGDSLNDIAGRGILGDRTGGDVAGAYKHRVCARRGVEGPGRTRRRGRAIADGDIPFELLAGVQACPLCGCTVPGGDTRVLRDLSEDATGIRPPEEGDGQWVTAVRVGDADSKSWGGANARRAIGRRIDGRRIWRLVSERGHEAGYPGRAIGQRAGETSHGATGCRARTFID